MSIKNLKLVRFPTNESQRNNTAASRLLLDISNVKSFDTSTAVLTQNNISLGHAKDSESQAELCSYISNLTKCSAATQTSTRFHLTPVECYSRTFSFMSPVECKCNSRTSKNSMSPVECYSRTFRRICCPHSNARTLQSCKSLTRIRRIADQSHRSQQYLTQHPSSLLNTLKATSYSCIISTSQTANVPSSQCHWSTNASKWHVDTSSNIALNILYPQTLDISLHVLFLLIGRSRRARPCKDSHISIGICRDFISMNIRYCSVNLWLHISGIQSGKVALHVTSSRAR